MDSPFGVDLGPLGRHTQYLWDQRDFRPSLRWYQKQRFKEITERLSVSSMGGCGYLGYDHGISMIQIQELGRFREALAILDEMAAAVEKRLKEVTAPEELSNE